VQSSTAITATITIHTNFLVFIDVLSSSQIALPPPLLSPCVGSRGL
jgi:hypothetical protein